ncbi:MAG: hypothetical protein IKP64_00695 [Selenomonadaceae bacterium]|nr:hypothetical protein [Selenomonadaceae bacterium]MBR4382055.1 hypothetical protein [Selenomonadaceae bacterium]
MKKIFLLAIILLVGGCGQKIQSVPPIPLPNKTFAETFDTDIYFDATVSMRGFTTNPTNNVYVTLPDLLGDLCGNAGAVNFFGFGEQIFELNGRSYRQFTTPEVYVEAITSVANVVERADTSHLSIIVTDLFESDADWSFVTKKIREKFFAAHLTVAVVGIRNSFAGEIFDVGLSAAKFNYNSFDDPNRYRPFYLLILGRDDAVKNFLRKFNERQTLPNDTGYFLLTENLSDADFSTFELSEVENFYSDDTLQLDGRIKEFGLDNFADAASFMVNWTYEPPIGACPIDFAQVETLAEIFSVDGENWLPREQNDVRAALLKDDRQSDLFLAKVSLTPEKSLSEGKANFVRIKISPTENGLRLPAWVEAWSVNVDGAIKNFDGSKTINLSRLLGSLKNSQFETSRPKLLEINFVVAP